MNKNIKQKITNKINISAKNLFLLCSVVIIVILFIEIVLRFTKYEYMIVINSIRSSMPKGYLINDPKAGFDIQENFTPQWYYLEKDKFKFKIWSNELSCFDRPYNGEDYILLLGDSFTLGIVPYEDKWGTVLERELGERIIKAGVLSYSPKAELIKARKIIEKTGKSPKMIIVGYFPNDMEDDYKFPKNIIINGYLVRYKGIINRETGEIYTLAEKDIKESEEAIKYWEEHGYISRLLPRRFQKMHNWFNTNSILYNMGKSAIKKFLPSQTFPAADEDHKFYSFCPIEGWVEEAWNDHLENIISLKNLADEHNCELVIIMIPYMWQVYFDRMKAQLNLSNIQDIRQPQRMVSSFCKKEKIYCLDLFDDLFHKRYSKKLYWKYDGHLNIEGNHLVGNVVADYIKDVYGN